MSAVGWAEALKLSDTRDELPDSLLPLRLMTAIYRASPSPILATDHEQHILFWNSAATRVFGYPPGEALRHRLNFLTDQDGGLLEELHGRVFAGETVTGAEVQLRNRSGEPVHVLFSAAPLNGDAGRVHGMVATLENITLRKRAERALQDSEQRYRRLFEQIADGIIVHRNGRILLANSACYQMLGRCPDESLVGREILEFLHPGDHQRSADRTAALLRGETINDVAEYRVVRANGETFLIESRACVFMWDGEPAIQFVAVDLTERLRQQERLRAAEDQMRQAQKMEAVGRLAGGIAHDFNNVLTAVGGFSALLREEISATNPMFEYVHEIQRGVERATSLTRQLLTFSKRQVLSPQLLDVGVVVRDLQPMLQRLLREDIVLDVQHDPADMVVSADLSQMEQVILNLAVNARDAMPNGGQLTIETRLQQVDADYAEQHLDLVPGRYVMLAVADTGIGMSPEVRERIFEPFYTTKATGTGLGLATVYGIVRQAGGAVWVYSEPGRGTRFKIFIPAADGIAGRTAAAPEQRSLDHAATVLLVEDDLAVRRLTQRILQRAGMTVLCAMDGPSALELARAHAHRIDVVLTDVIMPEMQGPELAAILRGEFPAMRVLFMSGYAEEALARHGEVTDGTPVIEKPFSATDLLAGLERVLRTT